MRYRVQITARRAGALGVNSEERTYEMSARDASAACHEATEAAYEENLENVFIIRVVGVSAQTRSVPAGV